jgi:hypothetical protein
MDHQRHVNAGRKRTVETRYNAERRAKIIQLWDAGERNIAAQLHLGIKEESVEQNVRRWKERLRELGHLGTFRRGPIKGTKFVLDEDYLIAINDMKRLFPDCNFKEVVDALMVEGFK